MDEKYGEDKEKRKETISLVVDYERKGKDKEKKLQLTQTN